MLTKMDVINYSVSSTVKNQVVLYQPEIPANTGNIVRLCANTNTELCLIEPLGFSMDDKKLIRAGLDYHEFTSIKRYQNWQSWHEDNPTHLSVGLTTKTTQSFYDLDLQNPTALIFGPETRGLPENIKTQIQCARVPMACNQRSLNLSNSVAIVLYETLRHQGFDGFV